MRKKKDACNWDIASDGIVNTEFASKMVRPIEIVARLRIPDLNYKFYFAISMQSRVRLQLRLYERIPRLYADCIRGFRYRRLT